MPLSEAKSWRRSRAGVIPAWLELQEEESPPDGSFPSPCSPMLGRPLVTFKILNSTV